MEIKDRALRHVKDADFYKKEVIKEDDLRILSTSIKTWVNDSIDPDVTVSCIWEVGAKNSFTFKVRLMYDKEMSSSDWKSKKYEVLRGLYRTNFFRTNVNPQSNLELKLTMLNKQYGKK